MWTTSLLTWLMLCWQLPVGAWPSVLITEVHPQPQTGSDWIEIYNRGQAPVSLSNWLIQDSAQQLSPQPSLSELTINPGQFLTLSLSNKLNNSGDEVSLIDQDGVVQDYFAYDQSEENLSWLRTTLDFIAGWQLGRSSPAGPATTDDYLSTYPLISYQPSATPSGSPTPSNSPSPSPSTNPTLLPSPQPTPNPSPSPTITPNPAQTVWASLSISEIMSCPSAGNEWIELSNIAAADINLDSWIIRDAQGNTRTLSGVISPNNLFLFTLGSSILNNSGDTLELISPDQVRRNLVTIPSCPGTGLSYQYFQNYWDWTSAPTPGNLNQATDSLSSPTPTPVNNNSISATVSTNSLLSSESFLTDTSSSTPTSSAINSPWQTPNFTQTGKKTENHNQDSYLVENLPINSLVGAFTLIRHWLRLDLLDQQLLSYGSVFLWISCLGSWLAGGLAGWKWYTLKREQNDREFLSSLVASDNLGRQHLRSIESIVTTGT